MSEPNCQNPSTLPHNLNILVLVYVPPIPSFTTYPSEVLSFPCPGLPAPCHVLLHPQLSSLSFSPISFFSLINFLNSSDDDASLPLGPVDIAIIPDMLAADSDDRLNQSEILEKIIGTTLFAPESIDAFNDKPVHRLKLSALKRFYEDGDKSILNILSSRHVIDIDDRFRLKAGDGYISMATDKTVLDYHLTVSNCIGFAPLLPNAASSHRFFFDMDLKQPYREFKGKHAMVGFDTKGMMLYLGQAMNEDVFLAMAPNRFLSGRWDLCAPGFSTGSSIMSRRHYHQVLTMLIHFLGLIPERGYDNEDEIATYSLDLDASEGPLSGLTNVL
jgi:hypothetical protein